MYTHFIGSTEWYIHYIMCMVFFAPVSSKLVICSIEYEFFLWLFTIWCFILLIVTIWFRYGFFGNLFKYLLWGIHQFSKYWFSFFNNLISKMTCKYTKIEHHKWMLTTPSCMRSCLIFWNLGNLSFFPTHRRLSKTYANIRKLCVNKSVQKSFEPMKFIQVKL